MPLCFFSLPPVSDHKPSRAGLISVSVEYLAPQSTNTSFQSKSVFKVTEPNLHCRWLAEVSRDEDSSTAWAADALPGSQDSPHLSQTRPPASQPTSPARSREWSCCHFYLGLDPAQPEANRSCSTCHG